VLSAVTTSLLVCVRLFIWYVAVCVYKVAHMKSTIVLAVVGKLLTPVGNQAELHQQSCYCTETSGSVYKSFPRIGFATPSVHAHQY
jgi:hypothetical protein